MKKMLKSLGEDQTILQAERIDDGYLGPQGRLVTPTAKKPD